MQHTLFALPHRLLRRLLARPRGMALLLVMIGMVVCTILTAGFLATQGTAIGIARNERDAVKCHGIAQTGIDMCYWLIKNKPDWRTTMTPGYWLSNAAIGDGTVTVNVTDNSGSFADDTSQPITLTSTGTFDNRTFTLTASIRPTGGGTVFNKGNFIYGNISLGNPSKIFPCTFDSYNSAVAPYNPWSPGNNALFVSNAVANNSLMIYEPSTFSGSYTAGPGGDMSHIIKINGSAAWPAATATATENRIPGTVIFPNPTGLPNGGTVNCRSPFNPNFTFNNSTIYDSVTVNSGTITILKSGLYYINHDLTVGALGNSIISANPGVNATIVVCGNANFTNGSITLSGNSQVALYIKGNASFTTSRINYNGNTSNFALLGGPGNNHTITIAGWNTVICGSIYAPQHDMTMQTLNPQFYGAAVTNSLTLKDSAALHFDEALHTLRLSNLTYGNYDYFANITGGSAAPGSADYIVTVTGGPGIPH